jgi:hypothetical protein
MARRATAAAGTFNVLDVVLLGNAGQCWCDELGRTCLASSELLAP